MASADVDIYTLAEQHVQPSQAERELLRHYVDAAIDLVERVTGLVLVRDRGGHRIVIPVTEVERTRERMFRTMTGTHLGGVARVNVPVDRLVADVYVITNDMRQRYVGRKEIIGGRLCLPPCFDGGCCLDDCSAIEIHLPGVSESDWPANVRQAVLQIAKWLYEHRGDTVNRTPGAILKDSGAAQLLVGYAA